MTGWREWSGPADTSAMQRLASQCWPLGMHPGGLGWSQATGQLSEQIVLVDGVGGELEGWAGLTQPGSLMLQARGDRPGVRADLIRWLLQTANGPELSVEVFNAQTELDFIRAGFEPDPPPYGYYRMGPPGLQAAVEGLTATVPDGYTIRSVDADEDEDRVAVHRAAWRPADLPFNPDQRPDMNESWSSSFGSASYRRVQSTWLYDTAFDLIAAAPDGSFAGCCIGWFDPATGWAEIEPVGVVPAHRRRGLALALCTHVARRVSEAGGHHLFINTGESEFYPAPYLAYRKAGFTPSVHSTTLTRR